jgi:hypothetical protein
MSDTRSNLQATQEGIVGNKEYDNSGWPTPLVDPSGQLKIKVTNGLSGSQRDFKAMSCEGQDKLSLTEGTPTVNKVNYLDQGGHGNKLKTSQQNAGDHQTPESERSQ